MKEKNEIIIPYWGPRDHHYQGIHGIESGIIKSKIIKSDENKILSIYLSKKCSMIEDIAKQLDVFDDVSSKGELLDRVLNVLGEEVSEDSTFFDKVEQLETIFHQTDEDDDTSPDIDYTGG